MLLCMDLFCKGGIVVMGVLFKYECRMVYLFVLSLERVRRVALGSVVSMNLRMACWNLLGVVYV